MPSLNKKLSMPVVFAELLVLLFPFTLPGIGLSYGSTLSFIQKVRVGLHRNTVRIVLVLDRAPGKPVFSRSASPSPVLTLRGTMPGAGVHRTVVVRTPTFKKYLSSIKIDYLPGTRSTRLNVKFSRSEPAPSYFVLTRPDRLVFDFPVGNTGESSAGKSRSTPPPLPARPEKRRIIIPGKNISGTPDHPTGSPLTSPAPEGLSPAHAEPAVLPEPSRRFRIILDAGHGGKDCGTLSVEGTCEKILVLDIVKRLSRLLARNPHFAVILTRTDDRFIPLEMRTRIANENRGDLFLSVHANADPDHSVRGLETFLLNLHSSDPRAQRIAERENSALGISHGDLSSILLTLKINHKKKRSWELAQNVEDSLSRTLKSRYPSVKNLGIRQAPFYVIMGTTMPAVLAEVNFLSNDSDARLMSSSDFREQTAVGLYRGIIAYFENVHPETRFDRPRNPQARQVLTSNVD